MTSVPVRAFVALGSNLGDRRGHLETAVREIAALPGVSVERVSSFLETEPDGGPAGQPRFLNGALSLTSRIGARELLAELQGIETRHGRDRSTETRNGPRTLDLDLVLFGDERIDEPGLCVPHPRMEERLFVLQPMAEIAPDLVLPGCGLPVRERVLQMSNAGAPGRGPRIRRGSPRRP